MSPEFVEVDVKFVGPNAKDVYVYSDKINTRDATTSLECVDVVTKIGEDVKSLKVGDTRKNLWHEKSASNIKITACSAIRQLAMQSSRCLFADP